MTIFKRMTNLGEEKISFKQFMLIDEDCKYFKMEIKNE